MRPDPYEREVDRLVAEENAKKVELEQANFDLGKTEVGKGDQDAEADAGSKASSAGSKKKSSRRKAKKKR